MLRHLVGQKMGEFSADRVPKYLARSKIRENVASEVPGIYLAMAHYRKALAQARWQRRRQE
ncbi:MAG: hypothetical protein J6Y32_05710 [Bacteroidales bacterium]|nr:hypothetical protein [Bacteroidales bacterium]